MSTEKYLTDLSTCVMHTGTALGKVVDVASVWFVLCISQVVPVARVMFMTTSLGIRRVKGLMLTLDLAWFGYCLPACSNIVVLDVWQMGLELPFFSVLYCGGMSGL